MGGESLPYFFDKNEILGYNKYIKMKEGALYEREERQSVLW